MKNFLFYINDVLESLDITINKSSKSKNVNTPQRANSREGYLEEK